MRNKNKPLVQRAVQGVVSDREKAAAAAAAFVALSGTLGIMPARLAPLRAELEKVSMTGDVSGLYWDEDEDEEASAYERFGSVAVVSVSGVLLPTSSWWMRYLGCRSTPEIAEALRAAEADANVKTIVLKIESPGGNVQGIAELADTVKAVGEAKRVISYTSGLCGSCAYWVASQSARIYASRLADVGCIGTLCVMSDWSKYHEKMGVSVDAITSTGAETYKGAGAFGTVVTAAQKADFKRLCDECQVHFTQAVADGRFGGDVKKAEALATGQIHVGPAALALGLVDEIVNDTFDAWLSRLAQMDGVDYDEPDTDLPTDDDSPTSSDDEDLTDTTDVTGNRSMTAAQSGKEQKTMTFVEKLAAFFNAEGIDPDKDAAPAKTAEQLRLETLENDAAARLAAKREDVMKLAQTAFAGNPARLAAMQTAIQGASDEATLSVFEMACEAATPKSLTETTRTSHGQAIDEPATVGPSSPAIDTSGIYAARAGAMKGNAN